MSRPRSPRRRSLAHVWTDRPLAFKGLVVVALPLFVLLGALGLLYLASNAEARAEADVRRAFAIQRDTYRAHALLAEAAAGARGYALTGESRFLEPYRRAETELPVTMDRLSGLIRDREIKAEFEQLRALTTRKREGLARIVNIAASSRGNGASAGPILVEALSSNKLVLDAMRRQIDAIQRREALLLAQRQSRVEEVRDNYLRLTAVSALVGLLGSLAAVYLFSTGIVRRIRALENNAALLAGGEPLAQLPEEADEIGRLSQGLSSASELLRAREGALRDSEERFRLVIDRVRDYGIFTLDRDGVVTSWNLGAERIKGWLASDILGRHFSIFYPPQTRGHLPADMLARARRDGASEDEGWRIRKDGSRFWANVVVTALRDERGELRGFAKVTRDMSDRREAEQRLRSAREEAVAASLAKSEFLSRTSHELRTPLNAILGFGQLLEIEEDTLSDSQRAAVQQITKAGRHLLSLINDLLDIASIEAGNSELDIGVTDLNDMLTQGHALALPIVAGAGLRFDLVLPSEPLAVAADKRRFVQVVLNLVGNAAKYARPAAFVRLSATSEHGFVRILVEDDGPGIPPDAVGRLFTAFDRLGQQKRGRIEGTGLGLALSKSLVESMGGTIGYDPGASGARFWFTVPIFLVEDARHSRRPHISKEGA